MSIFSVYKMWTGLEMIDKLSPHDSMFSYRSESFVIPDLFTRCKSSGRSYIYFPSYYVVARTAFHLPYMLCFQPSIPLKPISITIV